MIATFISCSRRAFSDVLEGVALKNFFLEQAPRLPSFFYSSSTDRPVVSDAMLAGLCPSILRGVGSFSHIAEFISAVHYTLDKNNLVSMK